MPPATRHYHVETVLGRGAFGTVYRARFEAEHGFSKQVALKVLNPQVLDLDEVARRLRDEARVLALLRHRAIVGVDRLASLGGRWAVVMDYIEGVDLGRIVQATAIPLGPALEIVGEIAGALDAALRTPGPDGRPLNVIHRDLKPSNLMLTAYGEVKILDFGGARADFGEREADTQQFTVGSLAYMAPERLDFRDSPASDVYALGAILYELVTGERFGRTSLSRERHLDKVGPALEAFACCLSDRDPEPAYMLGAMLAHDEAERPTARQVEQACLDLTRQLDHERLRTWAEGVVPALLAARKTQAPDELTGSLLCEDSDAPSVLLGALGAGASGPIREEVSAPRPPMPTEPPEAASAPQPAAVSTPLERPPAPRRTHGLTLALLVVVLILATALAWVLLGPRFGGDPPLDEVTSAPEEAPEVVPTEPPPVEPPTVVTYTPIAARPAAPAPAPPPPPALPQVRVTAEGDAARVRLVSAAARGTLPAALPAGSYTIQADFSDGAWITAGKVELSEGGEAVIRCSARFLRCGAK
ncbi:MAG: serine/threonine-protein kinase [Pseudomonadota bacterium]